MSKFKVGDRVRIKKDHRTFGYESDTLGAIEIEELDVFNDGENWCLFLDGERAFPEAALELVESKESDTTKTSVKTTITLKINLGEYEDTYELSREEASQLSEQLKKELEA